MKRILLLLVSVFAFCTSYIFATNSHEMISSNANIYQLKCQFSLNHYAGTISREHQVCNTSSIRVKLNCAQTEDVAATVFVYINGDLIASDVFVIEKGKMESSFETIIVPNEYNGMKYTLKVE